MIEVGWRIAEGAEDENLSKGGLDEISPTDHFGDVHLCIVDRACQLVAGHVVFPPNEKIAEIAACDRTLLAALEVIECNLLLVGHAKSPVRCDRISEWRKRCVGWRTERSGIYRFIIRTALMRCADGLQHVATGASTGENQAFVVQSLEDGAILRTSLTLVVRSKGAADVRSFRPFEAQPAKVLQHRLDIVQAEANRIQVIITQNQHALRFPGSFRSDPECTRVAQMKVTGGRRRKTPAINGRRQGDDRGDGRSRRTGMNLNFG